MPRKPKRPCKHPGCPNLTEGDYCEVHAVDGGELRFQQRQPVMTGCIVLDPFIGSGSTMVACKQTDRICYGIELDEKFCDVVVSRMIEQTGSSDDVALIRGGKEYSFAEAAELA